MNIVLVVVALIAFAATLPPVRRAFATFFRFRGKRLVVCPENQHAASVEVANARAAVATLVGREEIRLSACSRWPEKDGCGEECIAQIASSPEGCLVRSIANQWYHGRACIYCLRRFENIQWHDHQPALAFADGVIRQWPDVKAEELPELFSVAQPVCWNCMIAEQFRKEHPDLVTDRNRRSA